MAGRPKYNAMLRAITRYGGPEAIIGAIADGKTLGAVAKEMGQSRELVSHWLHKDPARSRAVQVARETAAGALADQSLEIADNSLPGEAQKTRLQVEVRRWLAERYDPGTYAQRPGVAVQVNVAHLHLDSLRQRPVPPMLEAQVIDVEPLMD